MKLAPMSNASIAAVAPAVFATDAAEHLSDRYGFFSTRDVLEALRDEGYQVTRAHQDRARRRDPRFVRHTLTLVHDKALAGKGALIVGEAVPTIILVNSHNGRTKFGVSSGLFRLICANGLMVADKDATQQDSLRHAKSLVDEVVARVRQTSARITGITQQVEQWQQKELTDRQANAFAKKAAELRFGETGSAYDVAGILEVKRPEDEGNDLWRIMNRVQENLVRGGVPGRSALGRQVRSRPLLGITADVGFNQGLWQLAADFAR